MARSRHRHPRSARPRTSEPAVSHRDPFVHDAINEAIDEYKRHVVPQILVADMLGRYSDLIYHQEPGKVIKQEAARHRTLAIQRGNILGQASLLTFVMLWTEIYNSVQRDLEIAVVQQQVELMQQAAEELNREFDAAIAYFDSEIQTSTCTYEEMSWWFDCNVVAKRKEYYCVAEGALEDMERL